MNRRYLALILATLALFIWTSAAFAQAPTAGTVNSRALIETAVSDSGAVVAVTDAPMFQPSYMVVGDGTAPAQVLGQAHDQRQVGFPQKRRRKRLRS